MKERVRRRRRRDAIADMLHSTIIPTILRNRGETGPLIEDAESVVGLDPGSLTATLLCGDADEALDLFRKGVDEGIPVSALFNELLIPAAHLLGEMWVRDQCTFADVTLGSSILHQILHRFAGDLEREVEPIDGDHSVLITPIPGENHILGAAMLTAYCSAAGWQVYSGINEKRREVVRIAQENWIEVFGISVGSGERLDDCRQLVQELRARSRNESVSVFVGGPPFLERADLYETVGADGTAANMSDVLALFRSSCH